MTSYIYWYIMIRNETTLKKWEEIVGRFQEINQDNWCLNIHIDGFSPLSYPLDSIESSILKEELEDVESGTKIGILRTDIKEEPLVVRIVE